MTRKNVEIHSFLKCFHAVLYIALKPMFHSRDSPRLLVCDAGVYLEQNDI